MHVAFWEKLALPLMSRVTPLNMWDRMHEYRAATEQPWEQRSQVSFARLREILEHAYANVPHYRRKFDGAGIKPSDIRSFDDLHKIPITTKAEIKAAFPQDMIAANYKRRTLRSSQSGATSGTPLHVRMDLDAVVKKYAAITRHELHNDWHVGDKTVHSQPCPYVDYYVRGLIKDGTFTEGLGHLLSLRKNLRRDLVWYLENYVVFPVLHRRLLLFPVISLEGEIDDAMTASHLDRMARFAPHMVRSHPLYAYLWARHLERTGQAPPKIGALELTGGLASDRMKQIIERAFGAPVYDYYGSAEIGGIAAECHERHGMHIYDNITHIEFLRGDRPAAPGETGSVVITDLVNKAMPFIRYWTDDVGRYHERTRCACGLDSLRMELDGRSWEMVVDRHGNERTPKEVIDRIIDDGDLYLFQFILEAPGQATLHVLDGRQSGAQEQAALDGLRELLGPDWTITLDRTDRLPPERRGKYCFVKTLYKQDLPRLFPDGRPD